MESFGLLGGQSGGAGVYRPRFIEWEIRQTKSAYRSKRWKRRPIWITRPFGVATICNPLKGAGGIQIGGFNRPEAQDGGFVERGMG